MKTGEACKRNVVVAKRHMSVPAAAKLMRQAHVGCLVVVDDLDERIPVGIVTDRDIVVGVVAADVEAGTMRVGEIMSERPFTVTEDDDSLESLRLMRLHGVRRMPVVSAAGALVGIVTLDDLLGLLASEFDHLVNAIDNERSREGLARH